MRQKQWTAQLQYAYQNNKKTLEEIREQEGLQISSLVRDSLTRIIALHQLKKSRSIILPYAEKQGIFTDEDVFQKLRS